MFDRGGLGHLAPRLALCVTLIASPPALAGIAEYRVTFDGVIANANGSWGGTIPVGASERTSNSLVYRYIRGIDGRLELLSLQLFDDTHGLASARFFDVGAIGVDYDYDGFNDFFWFGVANTAPGGWLLPRARGQFGNIEGPLPSGPNFDALVRDSDISVLATGMNRQDRMDLELPARTFGFSSRLLPGPGLDLLHCPGDVNGDTHPDLVVASMDGQVTTRGLDGALINSFSISAGEELIDLEILPDTNGNGAPEIAALRRGIPEAEVRDLLTGGVLGTFRFAPRLEPVDLEVMADSDGNGIPELAFLGFHPNLRGGRQVAYAVEVRDAMSAQMIARIDKRGWSVPRDLDIQPDSNGNGEPEVAVLVDHLQGRRADSIQIDDLQGGADLPDIWLGQDWLVLRQERIGDINGNGSDDVAVLRVRSAQRINVQIRDTMTNQWLSFVGFSDNYPPQRLVSIPDTNGNGASELVMFGPRFDEQDQKAVIKDSSTGATLRQVPFDINFPGQSFAACGDLNGNGAHDLALLGERTVDQRRRVSIKDGRTGAPVAEVWF